LDVSRRKHTLLGTSFYPSISIAVLDDLVRNFLDVSLNFSILELSTDKTLGGEEGVFWVNNGLSLCSDTN
jgi:hypothetical protein